MIMINLRRYYPFLREDCFIEVPDEVAEAFLLAARQENNYRKKLSRYKAYYSLDRGDGIENAVFYSEPSPEEMLLRKISLEQLQEALDHLTPIQARRVYAHYILGLKKREIARTEGVDDSSVRHSIKAGLKNFKRYFDKSGWME
jgi:DNA-directed RNA polymerase specialized sigma subunit, sigma24 homolog